METSGPSKHVLYMFPTSPFVRKVLVLADEVVHVHVIIGLNMFMYRLVSQTLLRNRSV